MKKYYDCSINHLANSLHNKESFGPIENDIMRDLGKYASNFGWERTYDYKITDLVVTNSFYPDNILNWTEKHSIPKIKRMDGIYWQNYLKHKNHIFNDAALQSDHVIFISDYSKDTLWDLYSIEIPNNSVILNNVDDKIFFPIKHNNDKFTLVSSATNWNREEKRLSSIISLASKIDDIIILIGKCDIELPKNIIKKGYIESQEEMNNIIGNSDAFLSLFFRDAAPKVVCQAIQCNLPILYTNTGGSNELCNGYGVIVEDYTKMEFLDSVPELNETDVFKNYELIKDYYDSISNNYLKPIPYQETLSEYFKVFDLYV